MKVYSENIEKEKLGEGTIPNRLKHTKEQYTTSA